MQIPTPPRQAARAIAVVAALAISCLSTCGQGSPPATNTSDVVTALARLGRAWTNGEVDSITVLHCPNSLHVFSGISPDALDRGFYYMIYIRHAVDRPLARGLMQALDRINPRPKDWDVIVHWGFVFENAKEERLCSIYMDGGGRNGVINGVAVQLGSDALGKWADKLLTLFDDF